MYPFYYLSPTAMLRFISLCIATSCSLSPPFGVSPSRKHSALFYHTYTHTHMTVYACVYSFTRTIFLLTKTAPLL